MWKTVKLGELLELQNGYAFKSKEYSTDGYFVMRITNVQQGYISAHSPQYIEIETPSKLTKFILEEDDILVSLTGDVGRVGVVRGEHLPAVLNQRVARVQSISNSVERDFLFHYLNSAIFRNQVEALGRGAAQANVSTKDILEIALELPPLAEQQRIVAKLDAAFSEIDRAREIYKHSITLADSCLSKVKALRVAKLLSKSQKLKLGVLASFKNGLNYNKSEKGFPVKILGVGDFENRFSIRTESLQEIQTNKPLTADYYLEHEDIVFVRSNGNKNLIGRSILIENPEEHVTFSGFCIRCRIEEKNLSPIFLCHYLKSSVVRELLTSGGSGSNISNLNQGMLSDIEIPILPEHEQMRFVRWIEELEKSFWSFTAIFAQRLELTEKLKSAFIAETFHPRQVDTE